MSEPKAEAAEGADAPRHFIREIIRADVDVKAAGELLTSTMFGLAVMGRTGFSRETLDGIVDSTLATLHCRRLGIRGRLAELS